MSNWKEMPVGEHAAVCVALWPKSGQRPSPEFEHAWSGLVTRLRSLVSLQIRSASSGMRLSREDIEDISQDAFLKLYRHLPKLENPASFGGLLRNIVMSVRIDWLRSQKSDWDHRSLAVDLENLGARAAGSDIGLIEAVLAAVQERFRRMDRQFEQETLYRLMDGKSVEEVAKELKISEYHVKKVRSNAMEQLVEVSKEFQL